MLTINIFKRSASVLCAKGLVFKAFLKDAIQRKEVVSDGNADETEFINWMFEQGRVIDSLMDEKL